MWHDHLILWLSDEGEESVSGGWCKGGSGNTVVTIGWWRPLEKTICATVGTRHLPYYNCVLYVSRWGCGCVLEKQGEEQNKQMTRALVVLVV